MQKFDRFFNMFFEVIFGLRIRLRTKHYLIYNETKMKNKFLLVPLVSMALVVLTGCTNKKAILTFGTYIEQSVETLKPIDTSDMFNKAYSEETYILATYQGKYSEECLCWSTFKNVIVNYMNKYHEKVFVYDTDNYGDLQIDLKIEEYNDSTPALYLFQGKEQLAKFTYKNSRDKDIFSDLKAESMYERIHKIVKEPIMFEVNDDYLSENINISRNTVALFIRSSCPDCSYSLTNVIIPYINKEYISKEILVFDLESYYKQSAISSTIDNQYQDIKDKYNLSESSSKLYGYGDGFVPTIQYYQRGILNDASVFFNDEVSQKEDGTYFVSKSFYSEERLTSLSYCKNVENNVLEGLSLDEQDIAKTASGYIYWLQEKAAVYHTPLLEAFLDYYCK